MKIIKDLRNAAIAATIIGAPFGITPIAAHAAAPGDPVWKVCATTNESDNRPNGTADCDPTRIALSDDGRTVSFTGDGGGVSNIEAMRLDVDLTADQTITFKYRAPADWCGGGAPRVYVTLGGDVVNTANAEEPCGVADGDWMVVTYDLPKGGSPAKAVVGGWDVAAAGVVFDNGKAGSVQVKDVKIGDKPVNFNEKFPSQSPSPSATPSTSVTPSPASPTQSRTPGGPVATTTAPSLPVTGDRTGAFVGIGALAVLLGGAILVIGARRKRNRFQA